MHKRIFLGLISALIFSSHCHAQLSGTFGKIFDGILKTGFQTSGSPGAHGTHFLDAAARAERELTPALNSLIASNISSFPLSSTVAGVTFDISAGEVIRTVGSLGPIFAETAITLGKNKVNLGFNFTHLNLSRLRGMPTKDIRFTFTHLDIGIPGLGDSRNESDVLDLYLDLGIDANIYAAFATFGITDHFDIGIAIPIVNVNLSGNATGIVQSFTFAAPDSVANHQFGEDPLNPELEKVISYDERATGIGDIALRMKFNFAHSSALTMAALLDIRLPTGSKKDFFGTGKPNTRFAWIISKKIGDFSPHLNIGYESRGADFDSDELEFALGFDQKLLSGLTIAAGFNGEIDLNQSESIELFPGSIQIVDRPDPQSRNKRNIDLSNIPERDNDNTFNMTFGIRWAASEQFLLLGNVILSLNDGGLRPIVAPTIGLSATL